MVRWLTPQYVTVATAISVVDGILLAVGRISAFERAVAPTLMIVNLPASPLILLDSLGREVQMSTVEIVRVNAEWAIFSGLVWALVLSPLFKRRER